MLKFSLKTALLLGAVASVASCGKTIEDFIEDEVGRRANDLAGERLLQVHGETTLNGRTRSGDMSTDGSGTVTSGRLDDERNGSMRVNATLGDMDELSFSNGTTTTQFSKAAGDNIDDGADQLVVRATSSDGRRRAWLGNAIALDFDHQTFGVWADGVGTTNGSVNVGSFGRRTATADMPVSGTATYLGTSAGVAITTDGRALQTQSQIAITTSDFSNVNIASTNTYVSNMSGGSTWRGQHLDFAGTGTISGNRFEANINGVIPFSATSTGDVDGYFYGDNAEEVGGTFEMNGAVGNYTGAFGADQ
ncbi:transferrin-binding protein-like solute binding protein [Shimia sp. R11_0]|uniref:transferrin-binding protein-like solute binding protein n=1 Tax=Shimia sp. R11_0 TaxID=2821096 RepID=UPI001ADACA84|nr:transferrin-binding protein-like solute binding protein [Shimia sp. R11_0]MBO9478464.1 transferrin-binding protein-like solute binding protein [Shimia sp. R11_0]